jgi:hypothetical protein
MFTEIYTVCNLFWITPRTYGTPERENPGEYEYGQYTLCAGYYVIVCGILGILNLPREI